ncbi:Hypothetical_protein [Hexamita inflata]|uniref:Hypothetical_protein n=1 Tax=Hexamita inflata TaxID=28002 RepID=A0AA86PYB3_9EUKA|nr:Hypothetical protein HINF_LOCUS35173 [Hexamita inflata]
MMISGKERGSVQDNWSKNTKIRNQFIADEVGMSCREWEEIHSNVCYGHIKLLLDQPEEEIDTNLDGIESDEEESENSDYEYDEDDLEELNKIFNDHEEEVLSQNKPKETKVRNSVSRVQFRKQYLKVKQKHLMLSNDLLIFRNSPTVHYSVIIIMVQLTQLSILNQQGLNMLELLDQVEKKIKLNILEYCEPICNWKEVGEVDWVSQNVVICPFQHVQIFFPIQYKYKLMHF